jgi:hypothetical protein
MDPGVSLALAVFLVGLYESIMAAAKKIGLNFRKVFHLG